MKRPPFYKSVYYAFKGLFWMLKTERNFQLEVLALVINLFLMVYFQLNSKDAVLIFSKKYISNRLKLLLLRKVE